MYKLSKRLSQKWLPWQRLDRYGFNQDTIVFLNKVHEKSPNFVAVAVFVAKIRIFEISIGTLCPPCKRGLNWQGGWVFIKHSVGFLV